MPGGIVTADRIRWVMENRMEGEMIFIMAPDGTCAFYTSNQDKKSIRNSFNNIDELDKFLEKLQRGNNHDPNNRKSKKDETKFTEENITEDQNPNQMDIFSSAMVSDKYTD